MFKQMVDLNSSDNTEEETQSSTKTLETNSNSKSLYGSVATALVL